MIYSAAHKKSSETPALKKKSSASSLGKKSTPTSSTQTTPRKSSRNQVKTEPETDAPATTTTGTSYADVAAHEPSSEGAGNVTPPRKEPRINSIRRSARKSRGGASGTSGSEDDVAATASSSASPARVTRSRSKGRTSGPGEE